MTTEIKIKPNIIAFYLPQYHTIPENDEWWGKGFTDWVNVKKAGPLFDGHMQPRIPLNNNYYDLSTVEAIRWQARLARQYGVDGFCIYHYWFNGKLLLEKPAEILLANKDIDISFCFSWANEPWARTWDGKAHQILIAQSYGNATDWKRQFEYLLPFFRDDRYMKIDSAPVFVIYKSQSIPCAAEMMDYWNTLATEAGFNGIHFVETLRDGHTDKRNLPFRSKVEFEPANILNSISTARLYCDRLRRAVIGLTNRLTDRDMLRNPIMHFGDIAHKALCAHAPAGTWGGAFVGWDNTPRKRLSGTIILPPTREEFKAYLKAKIAKTRNVYKTNYIFINAWNEWAEGTMLEPEETTRHQYLEVIKEIKEEIQP